VPFVVLLLGIAIFPLVLPVFWESNLRKLLVSVALGAPVLALYAQHHPMALAHTATDYISFMVLLGAGVISNGVLMDGDLEATPRVNALFLAGGALLASCRHDGRLDAAHPAPPADEPGAKARHPHGRLLHLPRFEHRRLPHPARRSAALPGLPAGCPVHVDPALFPRLTTVAMISWSTRGTRRHASESPPAGARRTMIGRSR
jgi:hypothetical protein